MPPPIITESISIKIIKPAEEKINHYGLRIMQERANCVHGKLSITSEIDNGCTVNVMFPLNQ